ncbi:MAG: ATPase, T2SS/T4P/T4SS family [Methylococcales bacterium]
MQRLGELLIHSGCITQNDLDAGLVFQKQHAGRIGQALVKLGSCSEEDILPLVAEQWGLPRLGDWLRENQLPVDLSDMNLLNLEPKWWRAQTAFPLGLYHEQFWVVMGDVFDEFVLDIIQRRTDKPVCPVLVSAHELRQLLLLFEKKEFGVADYDSDSLQDLASGAPIVQFVNDTIQRALDARASDIHFETYRGIFRVRFRVDGVLHEVDRPGTALQAAIISRIKLMAKLDISEKRIPQDGRIRIRLSGISLDLRVATTPCVMGEDVVLRLLVSEEGISQLDDLGLHADHQQLVQKMLQQSNGIILVTGPTGSGKSTTLYTFLQHLFSDERKIITVEDPVEYQIAGITQIQVNTEIGLTFAAVLRSVLRQDPDIVLIGEIRDRETAEIAVQAALTGHLVLSTLHTNDAPGAFVRLMDMGIPAYLLASSVIGVLGQRLVRKVCTHCKTHDADAHTEAEALGWAEVASKWGDLIQHEAHFSHGQGCPECMGSGYRSRRPIFEILMADEPLRHTLAVAPDRLKSELTQNGMRSLQQDGFLYAASGQTTIEEVLRVAG